MIESFGIKDILDIILLATLLYYLYKLMKESGTINIFYGVLAFIVVWVVASEILEMKLIGSILDKFMSIGLLVLVILFQEQIKRFLVELGSKNAGPSSHRFFTTGKGATAPTSFTPGSCPLYTPACRWQRAKPVH